MGARGDDEGRERRVILAAGDVVDLQFFLMDGARRYANADVDDLLASAAALDYALLLSSEREGEPIDDRLPVAESLRETMTRASVAALDLIDRMLGAPDAIFTDFVERHVRNGGIFDILTSLRKRDVVLAGDVAFRILTATNDVVERRARR